MSVIYNASAEKALSKPLTLGKQQLNWLEVVTILAFALFPLLFDFPYRVNIFLSWEGAYRLYLGHIPYKDFGLPMGFAYWVVPAAFFKIFGPYLASLVKAQVFLNIVCAFAFRSVLKSLQVEAGKRFVIITFFCLTYLFFNFWPWYNQTVFVYEIVALAFLFRGFNVAGKKSWWLIAAAGAFTFISFFTKQDGGGLAIALGISLAAYQSLAARKLSFILVYILSMAITAAVVIGPFLEHGFAYWFNYGQAPHNSRISLADIMQEFFGGSLWLKFYMAVASLIYLNRLSHWRDVLIKNNLSLFYLFTMGILVQASIIQVTSYTPPDNNIYYHTVALAFILHNLQLKGSFQQLKYIAAALFLIFFWWSGVYYKYVQRIANRYLPASAQSAPTDPNAVSKSNFQFDPDTSFVGVNMASWQHLPNSRAFAKIYMPQETVAGIERLRQMPHFKSGHQAKVLNMTELTPLAYELNFELEKGLPLWYHLNVGMFDKELNRYRQRIKNNYYDVVLYEYIPNLNNFYPFALQAVLQKEYVLTDRFLAPRQQNNAFIEVYIKNK